MLSTVKNLWGKIPHRKSKKICIFSTFSVEKEDISYVFYYLNELKKYNVDIIVVSTSKEISRVDRKKFLSYASILCHRENTGYDFSSYRVGLELIKTELSHYEQLIFANDSVYGPFFSLDELISAGSLNQWDIWGATDSNDFAYHLQSYFVVYSKKVFLSKEFKEFWENVEPLNENINNSNNKNQKKKNSHISLLKKKIIKSYEIGGSQFFIRHGYKISANWSIRELNNDLISKRYRPKNAISLSLKKINPCHFYWDWLIAEKKFPFIKKELININPLNYHLESWETIIKNNSTYPISLINNNRKSKYSDLGKNKKFDWITENSSEVLNPPGLPYFIQNLHTCYPDLEKKYGIEFNSLMGRLKAIAWWENPGRLSTEEIIWPGKGGFPNEIYEPYQGVAQNYPLKITNGLVAAIQTRPDIKGIDFNSISGCSKALLWRLEHGCHEYRFLEFTQQEIDGLYENSSVFKGEKKWADLLIYYDSDRCVSREELLQKKEYYSYIFKRISKRIMLKKNERLASQFKLKKVWGSYNKLGVNLVGLSSKSIGIGEDIRTVSLCLDNQSIPHCILEPDIASQLPSPILDTFKSKIRNTPTYDKNIICLPAQANYQLLLKNWGSLYSGRYNIGAIQWELPIWPQKWKPILNLFDEIWAQSRFVEDMFKRATHKPVHYMPLAIEQPEFKKLGKKKFELDNRFTVMAIFDANSWAQRKNPLGIISAFQLAFQKKEKVQLVIKISNTKENSPIYRKILKIGQRDNRIIILNKTYERNIYYSLLAVADVYISLHRSEGFGRIIGEAMIMGKPVISTNYSGSVDFANHTTALMVDGLLVNLKQNEYVDYEGQVWMDPNVQIAAQHLKNIYDDKVDIKKLKKNGQAYIEKHHSIEVISQLIKKRIENIAL